MTRSFGVICCIFTNILIFYQFTEAVEDGSLPNSSSSPVVSLYNDLIDETLKWVKFKYLCSYDPLILPPVTQDDLNVSYSLTISEIDIQGLSHLLRLTDLEIQKYDGGYSSSDAPGTYSISSTLGIQNVTLQFRVEVLKIFSLNVVDFLANGSMSEIDIPVVVLVTPSQRILKFDSISVENLDQLSIDLKSQNFFTTLGGSIPSIKNYIKTQIKDAIRKNLESHIGDVKNYLNGLLTSVVPFKGATSDHCPASPSNDTGHGNATASGTRLPIGPSPARQQFLLTPTKTQVRDFPEAFGLAVTYKSRVIGSIPAPGSNNVDSPGIPVTFLAYFDRNRNEFVINHNGMVYRHKNTESGGWPLTSVREENSIGLYAVDDTGVGKIKLNPFIDMNDPAHEA